MQNCYRYNTVSGCFNLHASKVSLVVTGGIKTYTLTLLLFGSVVSRPSSSSYYNKISKGEIVLGSIKWVGLVVDANWEYAVW